MDFRDYISDEEVDRLRRSGIQVPESIEKIKALLEESEADPTRLSASDVRIRVREAIRRRMGLREGA